jgi:hypothetical protein
MLSMERKDARNESMSESNEFSEITRRENDECSYIRNKCQEKHIEAKTEGEVLLKHMRSHQ